MTQYVLVGSSTAQDRYKGIDLPKVSVAWLSIDLALGVGIAVVLAIRLHSRLGELTRGFVNSGSK